MCYIALSRTETIHTFRNRRVVIFSSMVKNHTVFLEENAISNVNRRANAEVGLSVVSYDRDSGLSVTRYARMPKFKFLINCNYAKQNENHEHTLF